MMNEASIRPSSRNTFACSEWISSGWRAAPSRKRLHMMPTPMQAPSGAQADHQADADAGVGLDHGQSLKFFHRIVLS